MLRIIAGIDRDYEGAEENPDLAARQGQGDVAQDLDALARRIPIRLARDADLKKA